MTFHFGSVNAPEICGSYLPPTPKEKTPDDMKKKILRGSSSTGSIDYEYMTNHVSPTFDTPTSRRSSTMEDVYGINNVPNGTTVAKDTSIPESLKLARRNLYNNFDNTNGIGTNYVQYCPNVQKDQNHNFKVTGDKVAKDLAQGHNYSIHSLNNVNSNNAQNDYKFEEHEDHNVEEKPFTYDVLSHTQHLSELREFHQAQYYYASLGNSKYFNNQHVEFGTGSGAIYNGASKFQVSMSKQTEHYDTSKKKNDVIIARNSGINTTQGHTTTNKFSETKDMKRLSGGLSSIAENYGPNDNNPSSETDKKSNSTEWVDVQMECQRQRQKHLKMLKQTKKAPDTHSQSSVAQYSYAAAAMKGTDFETDHSKRSSLFPETPSSDISNMQNASLSDTSNSQVPNPTTSHPRQKGDKLVIPHLRTNYRSFKPKRRITVDSATVKDNEYKESFQVQCPIKERRSFDGHHNAKKAIKMKSNLDTPPQPLIERYKCSDKRGANETPDYPYTTMHKRISQMQSQSGPARLGSDDKLNYVQWRNWQDKFREEYRNAQGKFIDTHCHIDFLFDRSKFKGTFTQYVEENYNTFLPNFEKCVAIFCNPRTFNCDNALWNSVVKEERVHFAIGCHPKSATDFNIKYEAAMKEMLKHPKCVAVGEIGLDYSGTFGQHAEIQKRVLIKQCQIALDMKKPLVIHSRDSEEDILQVLSDQLPHDYVIHRHCFTGNWEAAEHWLKVFPNSFIGLTPLITWKTDRAIAPREVARRMPLEKLLLETDSPYFLPRGIPREEEFSHPGYAITVANEVAKLKDVPLDYVLLMCRNNTLNMYGI